MQSGGTEGDALVETVLRAVRSLAAVWVDVQVEADERRLLCAASQQSLMAFSPGDASGA